MARRQHTRLESSRVDDPIAIRGYPQGDPHGRDQSAPADGDPPTPTRPPLGGACLHRTTGTSDLDHQEVATDFPRGESGQEHSSWLSPSREDL
jgi:hypothetical protein